MTAGKLSQPISIFNSETERTPFARILLLATIALFVHGYHLGADDAAIYVPAIKQAADASLYPFGAQFFQSHAHLTLLPWLVGGSSRLTGLSIDLVIFAWQFAGIFLLLLASWRLLSACFEGEAARWAGVALLATVFCVPVAGTALAIADPYVTSRTISSPATIFAIACYLSKQWRQAGLWWLLTALVHLQMSVYVLVFVGFLEAAARWESLRSAMVKQSGLAFLGGLPFLFEFQPARGAAREALFSRTYFFVSQWAWYEWLGVFVPLALFGWLSVAELRGVKPAFRNLARTLIPFGLIFTLAAVVLAAFPRLENYTRLQPMRSMHLLYVILFLLLGGLAGEYVLRAKIYRWVSLFVPLGISMCLLELSVFPASAHVEWPGMVSNNPWNAAFLWIRGNTPKDAVFALDPAYMASPGEDMHGFRAIAERSVLADSIKDSGAVSLFPGLADEWKSQVDSVQGWKHFQLADLDRLAHRYPVTWVVVERPGPAGLLCPYQNKAVAVCRLQP